MTSAGNVTGSPAARIISMRRPRCAGGTSPQHGDVPHAARLQSIRGDVVRLARIEGMLPLEIGLSVQDMIKVTSRRAVLLRMERTIDAADMRRGLDEMLDGVATSGDQVVVERDGRPVAAVVPMRLYEQWKRERDAFFDRIEATTRRVNMPEDEAMALALDAQRAVRAPRRRPRNG